MAVRRDGRISTGLGVAIAVAAALLVLALAGASAAQAGSSDWLGRVNKIRTSSGLPPVVEDATRTAGIKLHLTYLKKTPKEYFTGQYESVHTENPASPYYTEAGAQEAASSDIVQNARSAVTAINSFLGAPLHAIGIVRPSLRSVAFARQAQRNGFAALDVISGIDYNVPQSQVLFPGPGSTIGLSRFRGEFPDPTETCRAYKKDSYRKAGLPMFALLTAAPDPAITAVLTKPNGSHISSAKDSLCVVTASNWYSTDTVYGPAGQSILDGDHGVLVIPRKRLERGKYTVSLYQTNQAPITWSFKSKPRDAKRRHHGGHHRAKLLGATKAP